MDTADQSLAGLSGAPVGVLPSTEASPLKVAPAAPKLNRQERVAFTAYLVMIALIVTVLAAAGIVAWVGA
jgi:hypothetical protein